ncbi:MAG TPA: hypothetical protein VF766_04215 [Pyrinomonadaceae bacterium]
MIKKLLDSDERREAYGERESGAQGKREERGCAYGCFWILLVGVALAMLVFAAKSCTNL